MIKNILSIILFFASSIIFSQNNIDQKSLVGFACYSNGSASETVKKFNKLLSNAQYSKILNLLDSKNNAEKYLAVIASEKLEKLDKIKLSNDQKIKIKNIKNSKELVSVCSGCMYRDKLPLSQLFEEAENNPMKAYSDDWVKRKVK